MTLFHIVWLFASLHQKVNILVIVYNIFYTHSPPDWYYIWCWDLHLKLNKMMRVCTKCKPAQFEAEANVDVPLSATAIVPASKLTPIKKASTSL